MADLEGAYRAGFERPETGFYYNPYLAAGGPDCIAWWREFDRGRQARRAADRRELRAARRAARHPRGR